MIFGFGNEVIGSLSGAGTVDLVSYRMTVGGNNGSSTFSGVIAGTGSLTKTGTGTLTLPGDASLPGGVTLSAGTLALGGSNNISGGVTMSAGTLAINNPNAIGSGSLTISGGTIDNTSGAPIALSGNNPQFWNGSFTYANTNPLDLGSGWVTLGASPTVTVSSGTFTVAGISGSNYTLIKTGPGTLAITGSAALSRLDTLAGLVDVSGTVTLPNTSDYGAAVGSNAAITVRGNGALTVNGDWNFGNSGPNQIILNVQDNATVITTARLFMGHASGASGIINQSGGVVQPAALYISGATGGTGIYNLNGGILKLQAANTESIGTNSALFLNGGTVNWPKSSTETLASTNASSGTTGQIIVKSGGGTFDTTLSAGVLVVSAPIVHDSALGAMPDGGIVKSGSGTLTLSGTNTFNGNTTLNGGNLKIASSQALQYSTLVINTGTAAFDSTVTSHAFSVGGLGGSGNLVLRDNSASLNPVMLTLGGNDANATYTGALSGSGGLIKTGAGTQTLSGSNSYSGGTTVNAGVLQLGNANALGSSAAALSVNGGTLDLHGNNASITILSGSTGALITNSVAGTKTLTTAVASGTATYGGDIVDGAGGVALSKTGTGTLSLSGSLAMTGLSANSGVIQIAQSASVGALSIGTSGTVSVATHAGSTYNVLDMTSLAFSGMTGFNQVSLSATDLGDLNGDGMVAGSDYGYMDSYFQSTLALGDLNGDGMVAGSDCGLLDYTSQTQVYGVLNGTGSAVSQTTAESTGAAPATPEAVPEPGTLGLLLAGALGLLGRRAGRKTFKV